MEDFIFKFRDGFGGSVAFFMPFCFGIFRIFDVITDMC